MDNHTIKDDELLEEISDEFSCCVCLELIYKPIVLSCGHLSCFWCVHKSMNGMRGSRCPLCRDKYVHFPSICQKLHFLLKKLYPIAYKKREEQVLKKEQEKDCFSPQIDVILEPKADQEFTNSLNVFEECSSLSKLFSTSPSRGGSPCIPSIDESTTPKTLTVEKEKASEQISKDDLICSACKMLFLRPIVLNCGHVYCEGCVIDMAGESEKIKCQECHVCDPRGFPKVCLALEQLLEEKFPEEYKSRRSGVQKTLSHNIKGNNQTCEEESSTSSFIKNLLRGINRRAVVHFGVGCDSCGVLPIVGNRYRCKDCKEKIGYDLCKDCYLTRSKFGGRFNQQHTQEHRFECLEFAQIRYRNRTGEVAIAILPRSVVHSDVVTEERPHESPETEG